MAGDLPASVPPARTERRYCADCDAIQEVTQESKCRTCGSGSTYSEAERLRNALVAVIEVLQNPAILYRQRCAVAMKVARAAVRADRLEEEK